MGERGDDLCVCGYIPAVSCFEYDMEFPGSTKFQGIFLLANY